jgi:hypothetical protein
MALTRQNLKNKFKDLFQFNKKTRFPKVNKVNFKIIRLPTIKNIFGEIARSYNQNIL